MNELQYRQMDVQDTLAATKTVCLSDVVEVINLLRNLQSGYLRGDVVSRQTTPTEALKTAPSLASLDFGVIGAARFTTYRLNCQGEWRNTGFGRTKLEFIQKYPFTLKQDRILKEYHLVGKYEYKVLTPTRENLCTPRKFANPKM